MKYLTAKQASKLIYAEGVSKKRGDTTGILIFRKGYFYRGDNSPEKFAANISRDAKALNVNIEILDKGDHWASFSGGASLAKSSHFWVEARISQ
jgi:hypothetical protein